MTPDLSSCVWRKSTRSNGTGGECVELARLPSGMAVRDSKNPDQEPLHFNRGAFAAFMTAAKAGEFGQS